MTHQARALGLGLGAMLATSAMLASGAGATIFPLQWTAGSYPAILTGETIQHKAGEGAPFKHAIITSGGAVISCNKNSSVATITASTENLTVISKEEECSAKIGLMELPVTITTEDCDFLYHGGVTEEPNSDAYKEGTTDLVCPQEKAIFIHIYKNAADHSINKSLCTFRMAASTNWGELTFHNGTTPLRDTVTITSTVVIPATKEGSLLCGTASQKVTYTGSTRFSAFSDLSNKTPANGTLTEIVEGNQIDLTVSDTQFK